MPDVIGLEALIGANHFVPAIHKVEQWQLNGILFRHLISFDDHKAPGLLPAMRLIAEIGGKKPFSYGAPLSDLGDTGGNPLSQLELGYITATQFFDGIQHFTGAKALV